MDDCKYEIETRRLLEESNNDKESGFRNLTLQVSDLNRDVCSLRHTVDLLEKKLREGGLL